MHPGETGIDQRRRRARRGALVLGLVALAFYGTFIFMGLLR